MRPSITWRTPFERALGGLPILALGLGLTLFGAAPPASADVPSFLQPHSGRRVVIDVPDYDGFDVRITAPKEWRVVRADGKTVSTLLEFLGARTTPAVGYVDEFGNVLFVDESEKSRSRRGVSAGFRAFEDRRKRVVRELDTRLEAAGTARRKGRAAREVGLLLEVRKLEVGGRRLQGYPQLATAHERLAEIERDRCAELYRILAEEGSTRPRKMVDRLRDLLGQSSGLQVAGWIERHIRMLEREITVDGTSAG